MRILGIDPGTRKMGYAILELVKQKVSLQEAGFIEFESSILSEQMIKLDSELEKMFEIYAIDEVAIESLFYAYNPKTIIKLAQFRGALCLKVLQKTQNMYEYTPLQVKQSVTGNGKSKKDQVAFMVVRLLGLKELNVTEDVTDAIAVGLTHLQRVKMR